MLNRRLHLTTPVPQELGTSAGAKVWRIKHSNGTYPNFDDFPIELAILALGSPLAMFDCRGPMC